MRRPPRLLPGVSRRDRSLRHPAVGPSRRHRTPPTRRLLRLKEAATYLGCSEWKLRRLVHEGKVRRVQYAEDGPWWFDMADLDKLIEEHKR